MTRKEFFTAVISTVSAQGCAADRVKEVPNGKLYAIEIETPISREQVRQIHDSLEPYTKEFGCKFLVLHSGLRLVTPGDLTAGKREHGEWTENLSYQWRK